jgi:hypothetical protein
LRWRDRLDLLFVERASARRQFACSHFLPRQGVGG